MRIPALLIPLVLAVLLLAGCGGADEASGPAPKLGDLLSSSLDAVAHQHDAKVHYAADLRLDAQPAAAASAQTKAFLTAPVSLHAEGGVSKEALTADAKVGLRGKTYEARLLLGAKELYVNLLGGWYGDRTHGLDAVREDQNGLDRAGLRRALTEIRAHADQVLDAQVRQGPDIDGATWEAKGHCEAAGIIALAQDSGNTVTADDRKGMERFCQAAEITVDVGAQDRLPRRVAIDVKADGSTLKALDASNPESEVDQLSSLDFKASVTLTDWGKDVTFHAPANPRPIDQLGPALLGLLLSAGVHSP